MTIACEIGVDKLRNGLLLKYRWSLTAKVREFVCKESLTEEIKYVKYDINSPISKE